MHAYTWTAGTPFVARLNATEYIGKVVLGAELGTRVVDISVVIDKAVLPPFRLFATLEATGNSQTEEVLKILFPSNITASNDTIEFPDDYYEGSDQFYYLNLAIVLTSQNTTLTVSPLELNISVSILDGFGFSSALLKVSVFGKSVHVIYYTI